MTSLQQALAPLVSADALAFFEFEGKNVLLHEDHRWVLPMVFAAQERGLLPRPVKVVLFDRHPDAADPPPLAIGTDLTLATVIDICDRTIGKHDDDWITAGIELGLLDDVFIFGVDDRMGELPKAVGDRVIMGRYSLPAALPADLSARARAVLEWTDTPILLDIDLDCFAYPYREQVLAWSEEIFANQFLPDGFTRSLIDRAGLITVCREAGCCGGSDNADKIWALTQRYLFEGKIAAAL